MKTKQHFFILLLSLFTVSVYAQSEKELVDLLSQSHAIRIPFDFTKRTGLKPVYIPFTDNELLQCNIYNDIRGYSFKEKVSGCKVLGRFDLVADKYVFWIEFGDINKERRQFLWVMDRNGRLNSSLEVARGYGKDLLTKQFSIWSDKHILVNQIFPYGADTVLYKKFNSFTGGRIDTQFKIEESGRIKTVGAEAYYGKRYERNVMESRFYEIAEGAEKKRKRDWMYSSSDQFLAIDSLAFSADSVDTPPQFSGGDEALKMYVADNLKRLKADKKFISIGGEVVVSFIINEEGHICNIRIERGLNDRFDYFAKELILHMPKWVPAKHEGKKVAAKMIMPVFLPIN